MNDANQGCNGYVSLKKVEEGRASTVETGRLVQNSGLYLCPGVVAGVKRVRSALQI